MQQFRNAFLVLIALSVGSIILYFANLSSRASGLELRKALDDASTTSTQLRFALQKLEKRLSTQNDALEKVKIGVIKTHTQINASKSQANVFAASPTQEGDGLSALTGSKGIVMSCPYGSASHNGGDWKPANLFLGVIGVAQQLIHFSSQLKLVVALFHGEDAAKQECAKLQEKLKDKLDITCYDMGMRIPKGYGVSKIFAIQKAPLDHVIWLDCDAFPVQDPAILLLGSEHLQTGATFWPDIEGHFDMNWDTDLFTVDEIKFPRTSWKSTQGFDSGVIVIDKKKSEKMLNKVLEMGKDFDTWETYSSGDKDLWHLAWMIEGQNFSYCQYVGAVGYFGRKDQNDAANLNKWFMASQAKFNEHGSIVILHQLWRSKPQSANFFGYQWGKLSTRHARYNLPEVTLRIDLETNPEYGYDRESNQDWDKISNSLGLDEMFPTDYLIRQEVDRMSELWQY